MVGHHKHLKHAHTTQNLPMGGGGGACRITSLKFNGSHFCLPLSGIHRMTGWVAVSRIRKYDVCARPPLQSPAFQFKILTRTRRSGRDRMSVSDLAGFGQPEPRTVAKPSTCTSSFDTAADDCLATMGALRAVGAPDEVDAWRKARKKSFNGNTTTKTGKNKRVTPPPPPPPKKKLPGH